ncbi:hypothetical protein H9P43_003731 [Blastocladiella emersonii ATCC 22665]|nr:hypothetical protein H9P43_003731 [Blastocladiella emersonii ATCC 22665]
MKSSNGSSPAATASAAAGGITAVSRGALAAHAKSLSTVPLHQELWLLARLLYKYNYTTRRMPHVQRLHAVVRVLRRVKEHIQLDAAFAAAAAQEQGMSVAACQTLLEEMAKMHALVAPLATTAMAAYKMLCIEIGCNRYIAFCTIMVALVSRVYRYAGHFEKEMEALYARLRPTLPAAIEGLPPLLTASKATRAAMELPTTDASGDAGLEIIQRDPAAAAQLLADPAGDVDGELDSLDTLGDQVVARTARATAPRPAVKAAVESDDDDEASNPPPPPAAAASAPAAALEIPSFFGEPAPPPAAAAKPKTKKRVAEQPPAAAPSAKKAKSSSATPTPAKTKSAPTTPTPAKPKSASTTATPAKSKSKPAKADDKKSKKSKAKPSAPRDEIDDLFGDL